MKRSPVTILLLIVAVTSFIFSSCKKTATTACASPVAAKVIDGGPINADGCSWQIKVNSTYYHVDNFPAAYQVNNLDVDINYTNDTARHYVCGIAALEVPTIVLSCIERR